MKVRTSLFLLSAIFVISILVLGYVMFHTFGLINTEVREGESVTQIIKEIFELNIVTFEYLSHHEERMEQQWLQKHDSLGEKLDSLRSEEIHPEHLSSLEGIASDYASLGDLFSLLMANFAERTRQIEENRPQEEIDLSFDSEQRLAAQILIRSQRMASAAFEFSAIHQQRIAQAQQNSNSIALLSIVAFTGLSFGISFLTARVILGPLNELERGVEEIGRGNLEFRVRLRGRNELDHLAIAFNDMIIKRKQAKEEVQTYIEQLERSNRELEQFAYVASHDLQEPLRMVISYLQLIETRYKGNLDDDADEFIGFAVDGANRMKALINDLLAFSRSGRSEKELAPTDSQAVLEQTLNNLSLIIEESGVQVTNDPLPTVVADDSQLMNLFQNLVGNAIKFRNENAPRLHVSAKKNEGEWQFSVKDNGIGIDPKYFDRIFVIFQRLHSKDEYSGTGIGLAICKRIVERHGGRIWVESQPGEGSTFYFTIPIREGGNHE